MSASTLPIEVEQLGNFESRMLRSFRMAIEDWDEVCSSLGDWESKHLLDEANQAAAQHRAWLDELIGWGNLIAQVTQHAGFPDTALRERVNARLAHLQDKVALWHGVKTEAEQEHILRAAFA
jgi:hypothetical protein